MKPSPAPRLPFGLAASALAIAALATAASALAKLPPPSEEAQAKAAEAKARAAHAGKVAAYLTCKSQDHVVGVYQAALRKAGKPVPTPIETPACVDPGAYVQASAAGTKPGK